MVYLIMSLMKLIIVFGGVAFFTLLERKVLSYSQSRKGPNKVGVLGLVQPIADAVKLIVKNFGSLTLVKIIDFIFFPLWSLMMMMLFWMLFYPSFSYYSLSIGMFMIVVFLSLNVFPVLGSGWSSKSKYSFLGAIRGAAQSISYEVALVFILMWVIFFFSKKGFLQDYNPYMGIFFPMIFVLWLMVMICETNRAPFDFAEGESELVSGFNTEYGSFPFALLFLSEYGMMLFLSVFSSFFFFGLKMLSLFFSFFISFFYLWVRASFPRFRYDFLMEFCWGICLPITFIMFFILVLMM